ncbi:hypothetical protein ACFFRR_002827 [Megaselia abdita]
MDSKKFCCCNVEIGAIIWSSIQIILNSIVFFICVNEISTPTEAFKDFSYDYFIILIPITVFTIIVHACMILGTVKEKHQLIFPALVFYLINLFISIICLINIQKLPSVLFQIGKNIYF